MSGLPVWRPSIGFGRDWSNRFTEAQADLLLGLLEVSGESRKSALEVLRRGPVDRTGKALVAALNRVGEVAGIAVDLRASVASVTDFVMPPDAA